MTKDEVLNRLAGLAARRVPGFAANRTGFTTWALEAENLFVRVFEPSEPSLVIFRAAVRRYVEGTGKDGLKAVQSVIGAFEACRSLLEIAPAAEIESRLVAIEASKKAGDQSRRTGEPTIRLFISHASTDAPLAGLVVTLLRSALNLPAAAIRCTSVDGYRLPGGADTDEQIRREVLDAEVMIGIISAASLDSLYVAFELGARWGADQHLIPLMAPGVPPSAIRGPLAGKNALRADNASQLHQLVDELGGHLGIKPNSAASYQAEVEAILSLARTLTASAATAAPRAHLDVAALPHGFELLHGIVWDMRSGSPVPYCEGCRAGSGKLVAMSSSEHGPHPSMQIRTYTCPLGHPRIVLSPPKGPPLTAVQKATLDRVLKGLKRPESS